MRCFFSSEVCASEGSKDRACRDQVACASKSDCRADAWHKSERRPPDLGVANLELIASGLVFVRSLELVNDKGSVDVNICCGNSECWTDEETILLETVWGSCVDRAYAVGWIGSWCDNRVVTGKLEIHQHRRIRHWKEHDVASVKLVLRDRYSTHFSGKLFDLQAHAPSIDAESNQDWAEGSKVFLIIAEAHNAACIVAKETNLCYCGRGASFCQGSPRREVAGAWAWVSAKSKVLSESGLDVCHLFLKKLVFNIFIGILQIW